MKKPSFFKYFFLTIFLTGGIIIVSVQLVNTSQLKNDKRIKINISDIKLLLEKEINNEKIDIKTAIEKLKNFDYPNVRIKDVKVEQASRIFAEKTFIVITEITDKENYKWDNESFDGIFKVKANQIGEYSIIDFKKLNEEINSLDLNKMSENQAIEKLKNFAYPNVRIKDVKVEQASRIFAEKTFIVITEITDKENYKWDNESFDGIFKVKASQIGEYLIIESEKFNEEINSLDLNKMSENQAIEKLKNFAYPNVSIKDVKVDRASRIFAEKTFIVITEITDKENYKWDNESFDGIFKVKASQIGEYSIIDSEKFNEEINSLDLNKMSEKQAIEKLKDFAYPNVSIKDVKVDRASRIFAEKTFIVITEITDKENYKWDNESFDGIFKVKASQIGEYSIIDSKKLNEEINSLDLNKMSEDAAIEKLKNFDYSNVSIKDVKVEQASRIFAEKTFIVITEITDKENYKWDNESFDGIFKVKANQIGEYSIIDSKKLNEEINSLDLNKMSEDAAIEKLKDFAYPNVSIKDVKVEQASRIFAEKTFIVITEITDKENYKWDNKNFDGIFKVKASQIGEYSIIDSEKFNEEINSLDLNKMSEDAAIKKLKNFDYSNVSIKDVKVDRASRIFAEKTFIVITEITDKENYKWNNEYFDGIFKVKASQIGELEKMNIDKSFNLLTQLEELKFNTEDVNSLHELIKSILYLNLTNYEYKSLSLEFNEKEIKISLSSEGKEVFNDFGNKIFKVKNVEFSSQNSKILHDSILLENEKLIAYSYKDSDDLINKNSKECYQIGYSQVSNQKNSFWQVARMPYTIEKVPKWISKNILYLDFMFKDSKNFNQNINSWDTSNILQINSLFECAVSYNQPLNLWNTSKIREMNRTFANATSFNNDLSKWNVKNVLKDRRNEFDLNTPSWQTEKKPNF
ncbi:BspA family leucine-rich repeat surface protein [Mesoplasma tabanidae]|uniref:Uncharacterized protein n=1 Tax=Mesoplasma tabanidae TaxID=219745 RepID=A0A2K8P473_9MOLU|nr:BspA family leucine-rich repeat surface protein [Mesoplasma tabanidae]ATZ21551.1 hypothetical protein MTABA_v1c03480 [Mesoplasma tabanidae]